jgi:hypothetical protein
VRNRLLTDCNGAEKYVREKILDKETNFFPRTSISLLEYKETGEELQKAQEEEVLAIIYDVEQMLTRHNAAGEQNA